MNEETLQPYRSKIAGFTLIELVVAILIFAIGIVGILKMHQAAIQASSYNRQLTEAVAIAQDRLERLHGLQFTNADMAVGVHNTITVFSPPPRNLPYNISWTVAQPATFVRTVALSVTWMEKNVSHEVDLNVIWDEYF